MSKCIIVGAGEFDECQLPYEDGDFLIAADGGFDYCRRIGLMPDLVVGDFDSSKDRPNHPNTIVLPTEKDDSDMAVAVMEGHERGFTVFLIYGGLGGRFDHSFANVQLLAEIASWGGHATLVGQDNYMTILRGPDRKQFSAEHSGMISVFAYSDICKGVCEDGLKYTLQDYTMVNTKALGLSNEFIGCEAEISLREGLLLVIYTRSTVSN